MATIQIVVTFLFVHRFPVVLLTSLCQFVYMWWQRRKLKLYARWYQAQQSYYQNQQYR